MERRLSASDTKGPWDVRATWPLDHAWVSMERLGSTLVTQVHENHINIYMHKYRKIIYECNMQCNNASTHQPMHAALKEYEGIKPQMGATMSQTMSAY